MATTNAEEALKNEISARGAASVSEFSEHEIVRLALDFALWLPVASYRAAPWLAPYAVRQLRQRVDERAPGPKRDLWGFPDPDGYFADDNSLIKGVVKNLRCSSDDSPYRGAKIRKGLICCHVWPATTPNPLLFSFVPNLVWLPRSLARYSDAHLAGPPHKVHEVLKSVSFARYAPVTPQVGQLRAARAWDQLPRPTTAGHDTAHEFETNGRVARLATRRVERLAEFLEGTLAEDDRPPNRFSKRYHAGSGSRIDRTVPPVQEAVGRAERTILLAEMRACLAPDGEAAWSGESQR